MLTLKELLLELNKFDHFRVYMPNRDCLLFESFFLPHSEPGILKDLDLDDDLEWDSQWEQFRNRKYCQRKWRSSIDELDEETKILLTKYGDHQVFSLDASSCYVTDYIKNRLSPTIDVAQPYADHVECLDIFILS